MGSGVVIADWDAEPVCYCRRCLSLNVLSECGVDYCADCGSTETAECLIGEWLAMVTDRDDRAERFAEGVEDDRAAESARRRGRKG